MVKWHLKSGRKPTGGKLNRHRKKRRLDRGFEFLGTKLGKKKSRAKRSMSGRKKTQLLGFSEVNVARKGKVTKTKILSVEENPANPFYVRRNIMTRGSVVKTELGNVKITSRPGQDGTLNGVLLEEKK